MAKAVAAEANVLCIALDLGAMKDSLVGASEARLRHALAVERAIVGHKNASVLWIWTTNNAKALPAKLRSRMQAEFFYECPTEQERLAQWHLHRGKYNIPVQDLPNDEHWVGREIERCCRLAWQFKITLVEAARFIVPMHISQAEQIAQRRNDAYNNFLDASTGGVYQTVTQTEARTFDPMA